MLFKDCTFLRSVYSAKDPFLQKETHFQEIATIGRSNVGKSSLLNTLFNKKLAKISSTPGKTNCLNFFKINEKNVLVDLPGYGFAKRSNAIRLQFKLLMQTFLEKRDSVTLILALLDARHIPSKEDIQTLAWAHHFKKNFVIIFTKIDKIKKPQRIKAIKKILSHIHDTLGFTPKFYCNFSTKEKPFKNLVLTTIQKALDYDASEKGNLCLS